MDTMEHMTEHEIPTASDNVVEELRDQLCDMKDVAYECYRTLNYIYRSPWMMRRLFGLRANSTIFDSFACGFDNQYSLYAVNAKRMFEALGYADRLHENRMRVLSAIGRSILCGFGFAAAIVLGAAVCGWIAS